MLIEGNRLPSALGIRHNLVYSVYNDFVIKRFMQRISLNLKVNFSLFCFEQGFLSNHTIY